MISGIRHSRKNTRHGTTVVETAFVLPVFLLFILGIIELGHALMIAHVMNSACRQAARIGTTDGNTTAQVQAKVLEVLGSCVNPTAVQVFVKDAGAFDASASPGTSSSELEAMPNIELNDADPRTLFMVRAKIAYRDVAIVPNIPYLGHFLDNVTLQGQAFMRHE